MTDPTSDSGAATTAPTTAAEIEKSRRDVLDLSLRNPLLNFRPSKRRGVEVVDERSREIFRIVVEGERVMYFLPAPEAEAPAADGSDADGSCDRAGKAEAAASDEDPPDVPPELLALLAEPAPDPGGTAARHTDNKLQTALTLARLNLRLRETFRQARLSIEEQGVNVLYLALGTLRWYESDRSGAERRAPLVLVPVRLARSNVRENFKLSWTKDEIEPNLSLEAKLRQDFGVRLPEMPSEDDLDMDEYLARVERAVANQPRWSVARDEIHLNFFSFSKLLIYKDLDPASWPEGSRPADHPLVRKLFGAEGFSGEPSAFGADGDVDGGGGGGERRRGDGDLGEAGLHPVVDADSSQTLAVLDAMAGRNLVIQGPPGTGKSQTITNLIGEALARGRTILFVAEKLAALEVVKRRLDTVHLGDACLELHSHKTNKRAVLDELNRTLRLGRPEADGGTEDRVLLEEARSRLNDYARAINSPVGESGLTPHDLVGRLARLEADGLAVDGAGLPIRDSVGWSGEDFVRRREIVREMQELVRATGVPREHLWWPCGRLHFVPNDVHSARAAVAKASEALHGLVRDADLLAKRLRREVAPGEQDAAGLARMIRTARRVAGAPELAGADHRAPAWSSRAATIEEVANAARSYAETRSRHDAILIPAAWEADVLAARQALHASGAKWWRFLSSSFRNARRTVQGLCRRETPDTTSKQIELLDAILEAGRLRRDIDESRRLVDRLFPGLVLGDRVRAHRSFADAASWLVRLHRDVAAGRVDAEIHDLLDAGADPAAGTTRDPAAGPASGRPPDPTELEGAADDCERGMQALETALRELGDAMELREDRFAAGDALQERTYGDLDAWLGDARDSVPSAHDVVRFNQLERKAAEAGIAEVAEAAASRSDAGRWLAGLFEHACYSAWLDSAFRERSVLAEFDGATHAGVVGRFRKLDMAQFHHNRAMIAERHWQRLPRQHGGGQLGVLRREFQKKTRHMPVRKLMRKAGRAVQSVKPVFMMSPLSIAKYIPPGSVGFDLVVFDEASQVRPVEALGALVRGRQAVVVGDSKQLPPTSFFDRMADDGDEEGSRTADLESILGMFCAQGAPERMLRWHYRSRHESLIAVSNHEFYDDRLVVFPSPDVGKVDTGMVFRHHPDAHYQRRGINAAQARTVAKAVMEHARAAPHLTLGVAAFSNVQARRIEDEVDVLRRRDPAREEFFAAHPEEPFFVKNLENVQGDERDVILISVGYGKIDGGYLPMHFGPLNREGGERRLNVLITRARRRCEVFSNFAAADLDLRRSKARGVEALKTFLEYAETGSIEAPRATGREADSPFEEAVARRLRGAGHDVAHQVGSAGFFIDLAVVDPGRRGRYLLGIECDGASYHSARSARDRDRLRQQVLEGLGWRIHRIWSTDWFRDPGVELARTEAAIALARAAAATAADPGPERAGEASRPLERATEPEGEVALLARPYTLARLRIGGLEEPLHEVSPGRLAGWIAQVVEVESPVHLDEATLRVRSAAGVRRSGSRIRARMRLGAQAGADRGVYAIDADGFLRWPGREVAEVRRRDGEIPPSLRDPGRIAPDEIGVALIHAVRVSYGIEATDAVAEATRLFAFRRAGPRIRERFRQVLDRLVAEGSLVREGSLLQVPNRPVP